MPGDTAGGLAGRSARGTQLLAAVGLADLQDVAVRCAQLRTDLGLPDGLWTAGRLADVLAAVVLDAGWPAAAAVPALLAVAADPATRSPARLSCPGPWWDTPTGPGADGRGGSNGLDVAGVAGLEAILAETGGLRVALQRQARSELAAQQVPLTPCIGRPASGGDLGSYGRVANEWSGVMCRGQSATTATPEGTEAEVAVPRSIRWRATISRRGA